MRGASKITMHPVIRRYVAEAKRRGLAVYHGETFAIISCGKGRRIEVCVDRKPNAA